MHRPIKEYPASFLWAGSLAPPWFSVWVANSQESRCCRENRCWKWQEHTAFQYKHTRSYLLLVPSDPHIFLRPSSCFCCALAERLKQAIGLRWQDLRQEIPSVYAYQYLVAREQNSNVCNKVAVPQYKKRSLTSCRLSSQSLPDRNRGALLTAQLSAELSTIRYTTNLFMITVELVLPSSRCSQ